MADPTGVRLPCASPSRDVPGRHGTAPPPAFRVERVDRDGGHVELRISGRLGFHEAHAFWTGARRLLVRPAAAVDFDLSQLDELDDGTAALLLRLEADVRQRGAAARIVGAKGRPLAVLELLTARRVVRPAEPPGTREGALERIGSAAWRLLAASGATLGFLGDAAAAVAAALRRPRSVRWRDVAPLAERAGADGLPIVVLVNFLVGLIIGFQSAVQLEQVGADIYVADLVGLSITRELAPLMTAVVAAGRTGAAYAAELGTMAVSEEIDALRTLGLDPHRFLVLPRVLALLIALPLLTIVADLVGVLGGLVVAVSGFGITVNAYLAETRTALDLRDILGGVLKAPAFAAIVSLVACERGLGTQGGAAGVGRSTTQAVVAVIFLLIAADAGFAVLYQVFGV